jgi:hypothetical protein
MVEPTASHQPESGPQGPRTATITVAPPATPPVLLCEALAGYVHRQAAG